MPMPRRLNYIIQDTTGNHTFVMMRNDLVKKMAPAQDLDSFDSLSSALEAMELSRAENMLNAHALEAVESHPRFREAMEEYYALMTAMLPSCAPVAVEPFNLPGTAVREEGGGEGGEGGDTQQQHSGIPQDTQPTTLAVDKAAAEAMGEYGMHHESAASGITEGIQGEEGARKKLVASEEAQLDDAFNSLILLLRRRRERADHFYATMQEFVKEYCALQQDLSSAEPLLKGSHLSNKIQQMKETVKRKYGAKVQELQKECVNKRRRANLPKAAVQVMEKWFGAHRQNPYPTEEQKRSLAAEANIKEDQVSNWFVNVRKRYWRPPV